MAERGGFEPPVEFDPYDGLANRSFRPLRHLSAVFRCFINIIHVPRFCNPELIYFSKILSHFPQNPDFQFRFNQSRHVSYRKKAEKCHITPTHFRRLFKELAGLPPQQFLIQSRLHKAAALLLSTGDTVKEIAHQTGWDNVFYFSRLFHQKYQVSPQQYRKEFHF